MTRALPRTNFNQSRLIRFLADLSVVDAVEPKQAFAERLGKWLDFADAITLHSAHNERGASPVAVPSGGRSVTAAEEAFARTRTALVNSIVRSCSPGAGETRIKLPIPKPGMAIEAATTYEPYLRFYLAHQRDMEAGVRPLRITVRQAVSDASSAHRQLAALDAALDKALGVRERQLLATVPLLLEKRFAQLFKAHQLTLEASRQEDDPASWMQPDGWLAVFCQELQGVLLAELDVRLQPITGLIEAFSNEANK